jgi:hypothetical protein
MRRHRMRFHGEPLRFERQRAAARERVVEGAAE